MSKYSKQSRRIGVVAFVLGASACSAGSDDAGVAVDTGMAPAAPESPVLAAPVEPASATAAGTLIDPNSATNAQLMAIPGMTQALADAVVAGRPFTTMTGVNTVLAGTLSEQQRDTVYTRLWKRIDLNKATGAEIQLIPGVGARMEHEFEEYRPYTNIERFRREIGKYVDAAEVARLEKYVEIR
ncbi:MAG: hypothetical protein ABIR58_08785 [Gemmatimonadaceae bacterium]